MTINVCKLAAASLAAAPAESYQARDLPSNVHLTYSHDTAGTHEFSVSGVGTTEVQETLAWDLPGLARVTRMVESRDAQGRRSQWAAYLGASASATTAAMQPLTQLTYAHSAEGRLAGVGFKNKTWSYGYVEGTSRLASVSVPGAGAGTITGQRTYDSRQRVSSIAWQSGGVTRLGWNYGYDVAYPQRRVRTASQVEGLPGWAYDYNARGEVTGASRGTGDDPQVAQASVPGQSWGYAYDALGNRTASTRGLAGETTTGGVRTTVYQSNDLNQYAHVLRPNAVEVTGVTDSTVPRVSVNGQPLTGRPPGNGEPGGFALWLAGLGGNSTDRQWPQITLRVEKPDAGPDGGPLVYQRKGRTLVRPAQEDFIYDADGNLTSDGVWDYAWDGENRLITATMRADATPVAMARTRVVFRYDAQGRRVLRQASRLDPGSSQWSAGALTLFVYDGWNLMAEVDAASQKVERSYAWGPDLSGTMTGAGGVGGLLAVADAQGSVWSVCTEVNGNVMGLIRLSTGALDARWDYDAFGNLVTDWTRPGPLVVACPFKFSTKYQDADVGLCDYGFRYYSPDLGRWLNRDPIGEEGGLNLYGMVGNDPVNFFDLLGLEDGKFACGTTKFEGSEVNPSEVLKWDDAMLSNPLPPKDKQGPNGEIFLPLDKLKDLLGGNNNKPPGKSLLYGLKVTISATFNTAEQAKTSAWSQMAAWDAAALAQDPPGQATYPSTIAETTITMKDTPSQDYQVGTYKPKGGTIGGKPVGVLVPGQQQALDAHGPPKDAKFKAKTTLKMGEKEMGTWDWGFSIKWSKEADGWKATITKDTATWTSK